MTDAPKASTTQIYRVFIKATPQAIWDAITRPEWTQRYGYACRSEYDLRAGGAYRVLPNDAMKAHGSTLDEIIVGEVIESDPPRKLVQTWHPVWDAETAAEAHTRLAYEIEQQPGGVCKVTITHDLPGAPLAARLISGDVPQAGGGWSYVLSDLKTLLETGKALAA
jgi:uncharacterized protein YndB with AHSA1/START domain